MSTDTELSPHEQAQQIWDQLEREDQGTAPRAHNDLATTSQEQQASEPAAQAPAELHNDEVSADANAQAAVSPDAQALIDRIAGLELTVTQQAQRLRQAEGRIGGLNSQLQNAAQRVNARGGDAPTPQQLAAAKTSEAIARLKEDYPEFGTAMEDALNERVAGIEQRLQGLSPSQPSQPASGPRPLTADDMSQIEARIRSEMQIEMRHEGWKETVSESAFTGWLSRQQPEVQMLAASESPRDAIRLLDLYAEARSTTTQRNQRLSSAAALPNGRQARGPQQKSVDEMTDAEYWRYLDEQDAAKSASNRQGR